MERGICPHAGGITFLVTVLSFSVLTTPLPLPRVFQLLPFLELFLPLSRQHSLLLDSFFPRFQGQKALPQF